MRGADITQEEVFSYRTLEARIPQKHPLHQLRKVVDLLFTTLPLILEDADNTLTSTGRELFAEQYQRLVAIDADIKAQEQRISLLCEQNALSKRFRDVPGVGPITATILASDIGDGKGYTRLSPILLTRSGCRHR